MAGYSGMDDGIRTIGCRLLAARSWLLSWAAWLLKICEIVLKGLNTKNLNKNTCLFVFLGQRWACLGPFRVCLRPALGHLEPVFGNVGAVLGCLGAVLTKGAVSEGPLKAFRIVQFVIRKRFFFEGVRFV